MFQLKTSFAIAGAGAVGLAIIARAAGYYAGADGIAFGIALLMAAAFGVGILELLWAARRTAQLQAELQAFPETASDEHVARATPLLRALLSARLDRTTLPVPGPTFAPFVVGLLVMLGLLGTFLGLFDTLRGAGQALTASTDIDALRSALKAPMAGLMRGFGTSAAGVASSAMLGLAMVFARRDISRLGVSLHAMASGPLARFTPAHRQLLALESLAEQGAAWPKAAQALSETVATLKGLETSWTRAHDEAATRMREQLAAATDTICGEVRAVMAQGRELAGGAAREIGETMKENIERTAAATQAAVQPLLQAAGAELSQAMQSHLHEVRTALGREAEGAAARAAALHAQIEAAAEQTAERDVSRAALLARAAEQMQGELAEASSRVCERMQQSADAERAQQARGEALLARLSETAREIGETMHEGVAGTAAATQAAVQPLLQAAGSELLQAMRAHLSDVRAALSQEAEGAASRATALHARIEAAAEQASERDASRAALLARVAEQMQRELGEATSAVRDRLQESADADRTQQGRSEALIARMGEASSAIGSAAQQQVGALQQFVEVTDGRLREAEARSEVRLQVLLGRLVELADGQSLRLAAFERTLTEQHAAATLGMTERAAAVTGELQQGLQETAALVKQAATLIHGGGIEFAAVADAFAAAVEKQREGARAWLESLGDIERAVVDAGEAAAADVLGRHLVRTHEVFERQLEFQQELIDQLRGARRDPILQARVDAAR